MFVGTSGCTCWEMYIWFVEFLFVSIKKFWNAFARANEHTTTCWHARICLPDSMQLYIRCVCVGCVLVVVAFSGRLYFFSTPARYYNPFPVVNSRFYHLFWCNCQRCWAEKKDRPQFTDILVCSDECCWVRVHIMHADIKHTTAVCTTEIA